MSDEIKLSAEAEKILEAVEKLSVLDLASLVKAMEEKFGVSAAAPVAMAMAPAAGGGDAEEASSTVTVTLASAGAQKIAVIKAVNELLNLGLKDAKALVDGAPKPVKENIARDEAEEIKKKLEEAGATVEIK